MIIRALRLRHGRLALPRTVTLTLISSHQRRHQSTLEEQPPAETERIGTPGFSEVGTSIAQQQLDAVPSIRSLKINDPEHPVAQEYAFKLHQQARTRHVGSVLSAHYKPHELVTKPPYPKDITLELLLASQAHIGHATSLWHPANARYIYGIRGKKEHGEGPIHIISLEATAAHLRRACKIVSGVTERGGLVLFVGTREGQARSVVNAAKNAQGCHLFTKWIPGSITNGQQILGKCAKKVVDEFDNEVPGFEDQLPIKAAIKPDLVVCLNPLENYILLHECGLNNIPTIGIVDTDANPTWVTYPIPANDDSLRSVQVIVGALGRAGQEGQERREALAKRGVITYSSTHLLRAPKKEETEMPRRQRRETPPEADVFDENTQPENPRETAKLTSTLDNQYPHLQQIPAAPASVKPNQYAQDGAALDKGQQNAFIPTARARPEVVEEEVSARPEEEEVYEQEDIEDDESADMETSTSDADPSLTDNSYSDSTSYETEDHSQFGGIDQLSSTPTTTSPTPVEETYDLQQRYNGGDPEFETEPESPIEQVEEVEKELGETPPEPVVGEVEEKPDNVNRPEVSEVEEQFERGTPSEGVKPEPPVQKPKAGGGEGGWGR